MAATATAFFLDSGRRGQRYCRLHEPAQRPARGLVVFAPPFAEEMNKSRRMVEWQSRTLAAAGHAVLRIDLLGCGDSDGEHGDARWDDWLDDLLLACRWLQARHPDAPLRLWGLRAGALLAAAALRRFPLQAGLLMWQPSISGKTVLDQFLRIAAAAAMGDGDGAAKAIITRLRQSLAAGEAVDVAGYGLNPALAAALERESLTEALPATSWLWLETDARDMPELLPASRLRLDTLRGHGHRIEAQAVNGPAFWQTQEIEDAPALIAATTAALAADAAAAETAVSA